MSISPLQEPKQVTLEVADIIFIGSGSSIVTPVEAIQPVFKSVTIIE
jgi:hypothetical protein